MKFKSADWSTDSAVHGAQIGPTRFVANRWPDVSLFLGFLLVQPKASDDGSPGRQPPTPPTGGHFKLPNPLASAFSVWAFFRCQRK